MNIRKILQPFKYEGKDRSFYVIHIILIGFFIISILCLLNSAINKISLGQAYHGGSIIINAIMSLFVYACLIFFNKGYAKIISHCFLFLVLFCLIYIIAASGAENPFAIMLMVFFSILCSIIFKDKKPFVFSITFLITSYLLMTYAQTKGFIHPDLSWKVTPYILGDAISVVIIFLIIVLISWLFNNEINKYILALEASEKLLQKERDLLEITVQKRTQRIKDEQQEKIEQLSKIAEFGKLAQGLFHDLMNSLTALSLNLRQIKQKGNIGNLTDYVDGSIAAAENMEKLINSTRQYYDDKLSKESFSIKEELLKTQKLFSYRAQKSKISINFDQNKDLKIIGNSARFSQLVNNLVLNAIEAFEQDRTATAQKSIDINFYKKDRQIIFNIKDNASGVPASLRKNIFKPFFTTKGKNNSGIGLSICKDIVESYFLGNICLNDEVKSGTGFLITIPLLTSLGNEKN